MIFCWPTRQEQFRARSRRNGQSVDGSFTLSRFFGEFRAAQVGTDSLNRYVQDRQEEKAENATINRELAFLKRAFRLALTASPAKLKHIPAFPHLPENNARQGFLADADYEKLVSACAQTGLWLRTMLAVGCSFGWRKGEVLARLAR